MARRALWTAIQDQLMQEIRSGQYVAGDKLPTEAQLATRFGVNRHTVRRALSALGDQGLVHARRGAGVFVAHEATDYAIGKRVRFNQSILASGREPGRHVLLHETRACNGDEADALGLEHGALVHVSEGLSLADSQVIAMSRGVFPAGRFDGFFDRLNRYESVTKTFQSYGIEDYTRASTRITAKLASPTLAHHLRIPVGASILRTVGINVDPTGSPIEYGRTWFAGDRVTLTLHASDLA